MATLTPEVLDALNALLEDQRASVEIAVALVMGSTDVRERETFTAYGIEDVRMCVDLREYLEDTQSSVTQKINGVVLAVLAIETYDNRLRAYADLHEGICERLQAMPPSIADGELRPLLEEIYEQHKRSAEWCIERAEAFAYSRTVDFRAPHQLPADAEAQDSDGLWERYDSVQARRPHDLNDTDAMEASTGAPDRPHALNNTAEWDHQDEMNTPPPANGDAWEANSARKR